MINSAVVKQTAMTNHYPCRRPLLALAIILECEPLVFTMAVFLESGHNSTIRKWIYSLYFNMSRVFWNDPSISEFLNFGNDIYLQSDILSISPSHSFSLSLSLPCPLSLSLCLTHKHKLKCTLSLSLDQAHSDSRSFSKLTSESFAIGLYTFDSILSIWKCLC